MSDNNTCYPYRSGAYSSTIKLLKSNWQIAALLEYDAEKIEQFTQIINEEMQIAEDLCVTYEAQYALGLKRNSNTISL